MADTLNREFYKYFTQLNESEQKSVLHLIKTFLKGRNQPSVRISLELYNRELEEAEKSIEAGHFTTQEELENEMTKW